MSNGIPSRRQSKTPPPSSPSSRGDIEALTQAVFKDSLEEAQHLIDVARSQAMVIQERSERRVAAEREVLFQHAYQDVENLKRSTIAAAHLEAQRLKLKRREQLLEQVFVKAREQLTREPCVIAEWEDCPKIMEQLLREAIVHIHHPSEGRIPSEGIRPSERVRSSPMAPQTAEILHVRVDVHTREVITDAVLQVVGDELGVQLQMSTSLEQSTGVIVETSDGHRRYDNTLQARLARMQSNLRTAVYQMLIGDLA
ncbi:MAG: hypothetical protein JXA33_09080 [Anaerolineae bacterium]|nr:hypothetical protein [Anaerolineae bacterium]